MHFLDECTIIVKSGSGGAGCAAFRREAHNPRGGPSGGDGGNGGSVILVANPQKSTLLDLQYQHEYRARPGAAGQGRDRYGHHGEDLLIEVPLGTLVRNKQGNVLVDMEEAGQRFIAAKGGKGGRGNIHFATATNQAPTKAEPGEPAEEHSLKLELKLLADVGLLGYPNVGKSTFLSCISAARPKIANYPFTTLVPQLGVVQLPLGKPCTHTMIVADIPGIIEGAHQGRGLGHQFLRHVERTKLLLHLIEVNDEPDRDPVKDYHTLNRELALYSAQLAARPQIAVLTKMDLPTTKDAFASIQRELAKNGVPLYGISSATTEGLHALLEDAFSQIHLDLAQARLRL